jgi:ribonuclease E
MITEVSPNLEPEQTAIITTLSPGPEPDPAALPAPGEQDASSLPDPAEISAAPERPKRGWWRRGA